MMIKSFMNEAGMLCIAESPGARSTPENQAKEEEGTEEGKEIAAFLRLR
jgi:hypothetical protein